MKCSLNNMLQQQQQRQSTKATGDATRGMRWSEVAHQQVPLPINGSAGDAVTEGLCRETMTQRHPSNAIITSGLVVLRAVCSAEPGLWKCTPRASYRRVAWAVVTFSSKSDNAETGLQVNKGVWTNQDPKDSHLALHMTQLVEGHGSAGGARTGNCAITGTCINGRVPRSGKHWTGSEEQWTPVKLRYFHSCSGHVHTLMLSCHRRWQRRRGVLCQYDDVVHSHQCHTCHCPHQHKDEPSAMVEWWGVLVFDAEPECLEHLLPGPMHQRHWYDVLDEGASVGTREANQKLYALSG